MKPFNGHFLKIVALGTMLIDHFGAIFFPQYRVLRCIGRLAFPLFCFLLTEGFVHTRSRKKQLLWLFVFGVISEIPFDLSFFGRVPYTGHQNVFFTLALAYFALIAYDFISKNERFSGYVGTAIGFAAVIAVMLAAELLNTDYGAAGVAQVFVFYALRKRPLILFLVFAGLNIGFYSGIQSFAVLAYPLILGYNGKRGRQLKWLFYAVYPVHLTLYFILALLTGRYSYDTRIFFN